MNNLRKEKERIRQEQLINKINSMSPEARRKYMAKLAIKMRLDAAKMKDLEEKDSKFASHIRKKKMKDWQIPAWLLSHAFGGFMAGGLISANMPPVESLTVDDNIGVAMLCGSVMGGIIGMFNGMMWEERPITNAINDLREHFNEKKMRKLSEKMELDQIVADGVVDMSAQGDYEDAEAYSNY